MELKAQKRIAAEVLKCSPNRIRFDIDRLSEIKESITKADIKSLINDKVIFVLPIKGISRFRAKKIQKQKTRGQRRGFGSRKGKASARLPAKKSWMARIRAQRALLRELKDKKIINKTVFRDLYTKARGGFFRSKRHIKMYIEERGLAKK